MITIKEVEIKMLINKEMGLKIINDLSYLINIGGFEFGILEYNKILDAYFDTEEYTFGKSRSYLRARCRDNSRYITFRIMEKIKLKKPIIKEVTHALNDIGVIHVFDKINEEKSEKLKPDFSEIFYDDVFYASGLKEVVRINTDRAIRDVFSNDIKVALIKIDRFKYNNDEVDKFEIEIDTYEDTYHNLGLELQSKIIEKFNPYIVINKLSKYERWLFEKGIIVGD